jgi:sugar lactone lactonase YvrE
VKLRISILVLAALASAGLGIAAKARFDQVASSRLLHTGWRISPVGEMQPTGDMIHASAVSPDGSLVAFVGAGFGTPKLTLVDAQSGKVKSSLSLRRALNGVAFAPDGGTIYVTGGASIDIHRARRQGDTFALGDPLRVSELKPADTYFAGAALSLDGRTLFVANLPADEILAIDTETAKVLHRRAFSRGDRPYALQMTSDGRLLATLWGGGSLVSLDPTTLEVVRRVETGSHPNAIAIHRDGRLFVSCGNDDEVDVIDAEGAQVAERIRARLTPEAPAGSVPTAVALSPNGKRLYVALSGNNAVAVVDISTPGMSRPMGMIPTAWYPTALHPMADGENLLIAIGKGMGTSANPITETSEGNRPFKYIGSMLEGYLTKLALPSDEELSELTQQVRRNSPYRDAHLEAPVDAPKPGDSALPSKVGDPSPIEHVIYIMKENRTYDQVFGDFRDADGKPRGNGDPKLVMYGEDVAPNHHELARQYVQLDNLYCDGEVSQDGHPWSTEAYLTDFLAKAWPIQYSGKGDAPGHAKLNQSPNGAIWDIAAAAKKTVRGYYGRAREFLSPRYTDAQDNKKDPANGNRPRDTDLVEAFVADLRDSEIKGEFPHFTMMSLPEDHTRGTRAGFYSPRASVASNDVALGRLVEACSKSKFWPKMAIFVIEDDAQNGPDHVDAHRTVGLVISPYTRRGVLDSTHYTTASILRSIELILGLKPMSQTDAGATPMYKCFGKTPDTRPYTALDPRIDLSEKNTSASYGAAESLKLNLEDDDNLTIEDEQTLNRILWHAARGAKTPFPGVVRAGYRRRDKDSD